MPHGIAIADVELYTAIDRRDQHFGWITAASASDPAETVITRSQ